MSANPEVDYGRNFWAKVRVQPDGCWLWQGAPSSGGYGRVYRGRSDRWLAHRYAWLLVHGEEAPPLLMHSCDTPLCVNVLDHVRPGTPAANAADRDAKGRGRHRGHWDRCRQGHSLDDAYVRPNGYRRCRTCALTRWRNR